MDRRLKSLLIFVALLIVLNFVFKELNYPGDLAPDEHGPRVEGKLKLRHTGRTGKCRTLYEC